MKDLEKDYAVGFFAGVYAGFVVIAANVFVLNSQLSPLLGLALFVIFLLIFYFLGLFAIKLHYKFSKDTTDN